MTAIDDFWTSFHAYEPHAQLGGILAYKPGFHAPRNWLKLHYPNDYSIAEYAVDRQGPGNEPSAIDLTFPEAQSGNYTRIKKYSQRLLAAGKANDPRTVYFREFFGNPNGNGHNSGYDFTRNQASVSPDNSHTWHIHISWHRAYTNLAAAARALLSILKGESIASWKAREAGKPILKQGSEGTEVRKIQLNGNRLFVSYKSTPMAVDGEFGDQTDAFIREFQRAHKLTVDGVVGAGTRAALLAAKVL